MPVPRQPYPRFRDRHRWEDLRRAASAIALAVPLALLLVGFGALLASLPEPPVKLREPPANVSLLDMPAQQWAENRRVSPSNGHRPAERRTAASSTPAPEKAKPKPPEPEHIPGQVVDVAPTPDQNPPADTHLYSEYNTHVEHETQSRDKSRFYKNAMPRHTAVQKPQKLPGKDVADKVQAVGQPIAGKERAGQTAQDVGHRMEIPSAQKRSRLALNPGPGGHIPERTASEEVRGNSNRLRIEAGKGEGESPRLAGGGGTGAHLDLMPSQSVLDRIAGAPAPDHLEGIEEGEGTYLNSREWKYAGFFNRVKQSVAEHWDPGSAMRRRDPSGQIYGWRDRRTILSVTLDKNGSLRTLTIERSCGVDFLDQEAMDAFRRAQPFPNPPTALVDGTGGIQFSFGFYLEMNSGGLMQLFRGSPD